jgi:hypothetical protein
LSKVQLEQEFQKLADKWMVKNSAVLRYEASVRNLGIMDFTQAADYLRAKNTAFLRRFGAVPRQACLGSSARSATSLFYEPFKLRHLVDPSASQLTWVCECET